MEVDSQGNAYVTGTVANSLYKTNSDFVTIKYLSNGDQQWLPDTMGRATVGIKSAP